MKIKPTLQALVTAITFMVADVGNTQSMCDINASHALTGSNAEIQVVIRNRIDTVFEGDHIRASIYIFTNKDTENALKRALGRGVLVSVLSEESKYSGDQKELLDRLTAEGANVILCQNSCHGIGINHDKVFITNNWSIVSSVNLSGSRRYEAGMIFERAEAPVVHEFLIDRFSSQVNGTTVPAHSVTYQGQLGVFNAGPTELNFYADWISKMGYVPGCRLEVAMGHFKPSEKTHEIITELRRLESRGCKVDVIFSGNYDQKIQQWAEAPCTLQESPFEIEWQSNVHAKFMTYSGLYNNEYTQVVWSGSVNFSKAAFTKNDDVGVRSTSQSDYNAYHDYFLDIEASESGIEAKRWRKQWGRHQGCVL